MVLKHPEYASGISNSELIKEAIEFCDEELDSFNGMEFDDDSEVCCQRSNTFIRELVLRLAIFVPDANFTPKHVNSGEFRSVTHEEWRQLGGDNNPECDWHEGVGYVVYDEVARQQYREKLSHPSTN